MWKRRVRRIHCRRRRGNSIPNTDRHRAMGPRRYAGSVASCPSGGSVGPSFRVVSLKAESPSQYRGRCRPPPLSPEATRAKESRVRPGRSIICSARQPAASWHLLRALALMPETPAPRDRDRQAASYRYRQVKHKHKDAFPYRISDGRSWLVVLVVVVYAVAFQRAGAPAVSPVGKDGSDPLVGWKNDVAVEVDKVRVVGNAMRVVAG